MENKEIIEQLDLIKLLLNDIPKKYQFLDENKLKTAITLVLLDYKLKG